MPLAPEPINFNPFPRELSNESYMRKTNMKILTSCIFSALLLTTFSTSADDGLAAGFRNPPETTKPYCYWYWLNGDMTADGITKDLEAMARAGIKQAMIGNIEFKEVTAQEFVLEPCNLPTNAVTLTSEPRVA